MSKKGLSLDLFIVFDTSPQLTNCLCDMCLKFMNGLKIFFFLLSNSTTNNRYKINNGNEKWVHKGWKSTSIINHSFNVLFDLR
jgi:hypothetical protein